MYILSYQFWNSTPFMLVRKIQFLIAISVFFYAGLSPFDPQHSSFLPPTALHIFGNMLLIGSLWVAFHPRVSLSWLIPIALLLSISCEFAQSFTQNRHSNAWDYFCNSFGIVLGAGLCWILQKKVLHERQVEV